MDRCSGCGECALSCELLARFGTPQEIARGIKAKDPDSEAAAFLCSMCGLCGSVCPELLDPMEMLYSLRVKQVLSGAAPYPAHRGLLDYERRGVSPRYTFYSLPEGARRVFFPGCTLPGIRPHVTYNLLELLNNCGNTTGIVLDCCAKPSQLLGRVARFEAFMREMVNFLARNRVEELLFACPNCFVTFREFGAGFRLRTVYEAIGDHGMILPKLPQNATVAIHDPCVLRDEPGVHRAVRGLAARLGLNVEEMDHSGENAICCGEGGGAGFVSGELAGRWRQKRVEESGGKRILTYCAGCMTSLGRETNCLHILDLVAGKGLDRHLIPRAPFTYLNRLRLKRWLKGRAGAGVVRERPEIVI